jgi:hypothetical protein
MRCFLLALCIALTGCTNNQLRRSTVGQVHTLTEIQHQQVLQNLATFAGNPYAIPRHVTLHDGTAQITDNGSILGQLVTGRFLQIGGQRTVVDQWSMTPITNDVALRIMQVAYRNPFGANQNLYSQDLTNDLAHELKKQTYMVDDLRTTNQNAFAPDSPLGKVAPSQVHANIPIMQNGLGNRNVEVLTAPTSEFGYDEETISSYRKKLNSVLSSNGANIIMPGEILSPTTLAYPQIPGSTPPMFKDTTPLVIELRRQVYEANKDLQDIHPGWLGRSTNKHEIPKDACYVAWSKECGKVWYVWVCPDHLKEFEDFTIKILNFSGLIKEPTVSGAAGVKFTPSGSMGAAR